MFTKATGVNKKLKVLVYGPSGAGKTHLALTFPKVAAIDCEGGTELFSDRFDFDVLRTKNIDEVLEALESIDPKQYSTVVIDPVTVLWQVLMEAGQIAAENRAKRQRRNPEEATLTPRDWGIIKRKVNALYTRLVNMPVHVVVCGRIKDVNESRGTEVVKVGERVDAEKTTEYLFDIIVKLVIENGKRIGIVEKDRSGKLQGKRIPDPSFASFSEILKIVSTGKVESKAADPTEVATQMTGGFDETQLEADITHAAEVVVEKPAAPNSNEAVPDNLPTAGWYAFLEYAAKNLELPNIEITNTLKKHCGQGKDWTPWTIDGKINGEPSVFWAELTAHKQRKAQA